MAECEGVTEALKATDQMEWVRRMESIKSRIEEILYHDYIYEEEYRNEEILEMSINVQSENTQNF